MSIPTDRLREIADGAMGIGAPLVLTQAEQVAVCAQLLACREERDAARAEVEQARRDGQEQTAGLHEKLAEVRAEAEKLRIESQANADSLGDWRRKAEFLLQEREQGIAARETLDDVCKALCADIDSAVAQALMFKEKAGELAAVKRQRDELLAASEPVADALRDVAGDGHRAYLDAYESAVAKALAAEQPKRDWPEDAADEDSGSYQCRCFFCGATFTGHKRRVVCKACAEQPKPQQPEVQP